MSDPGRWRLAHILAAYAGAGVLVASLLVVARASSAWLAVLIVPIPLLMIWRPSRVHWLMLLVLSLAYLVVNLANHPDALAATARSSVAVIVTVGVISETLYHTSCARLRAEAALSARNAELAQAVQRANELTAIAQEASQIKSEFLASTSHELRTPLTGIIGALDLVLDNHCQDSDEERRFIQIAHTSSQKLLLVVNAILDIARLEAGKVEIEREVIDVACVLGEVTDLLRVPAADRGLRLNVCPPASGPSLVLADADKVRQILLNLVGNAIKFTEHGEVCIRLAPEPATGVLQVSVSDTGIGIRPEHQGRLFQPFVQAEPGVARRYGGTGLGLSISRRLAERMGGSVSLFSAGIGLGSTFTLTLPLAPVATPEPPRQRVQA